jgi:hypothetical protein
MTTLSEICVYLGRIDDAMVLYDWLRPWDAQVSVAHVTSQGPVAFHLSCLATLVGRFDEADGWLMEALDVSQKLGFAYWIPRTQIAEVRLLRNTDQEADKAKGLLADAPDTARQHGFRALVAQAEALA